MIESKLKAMHYRISSSVVLVANGSGIAEGRDLETKSFNLAQIPNRITNDCLTENPLLLAIPC